MAAASAYILKVPFDRRNVLLSDKSSTLSAWDAAEPVESFNHPRSTPLIVLASFQDGYVTHIADGRKGMSAGTGLVRLNMRALQALSRPIVFRDLVRQVPANVRRILEARFKTGGLLPPQTMRAVVDALQQLDPRIADRLSRLSAERALRIAALAPKEKQNLALQKEALTTALQVAGLDTDEVLDWELGEMAPTSFLQGLPQTYAREDVMLHTDLTSLPGFSVLHEAPHLAAKTFVAEDNPSNRVTVIMANRLALEEQTGADLIYYNEKFRSFVLVQYKAFEKRNDVFEFRWNAGDQFEDELRRMDQMLTELENADPETDPDGFRLSANPFFLKFCPRIVFNPDDKSMFPGLYLPHGLWKSLAASGRLKGPAGGNLLTYENVGRRVSNSEFVTLVGGAWVGTTINQSGSLADLIRKVLETGRTITFAVKRSAPPLPVADPLPIDDDPFMEKLAVLQ